MYIKLQQLMTIAEVSSELRLGKSTVWRLVRAGALPKPIRIGGSTRWIQSEIEEFIRSTVEKSRGEGQ